MAARYGNGDDVGRQEDQQVQVGDRLEDGPGADNQAGGGDHAGDIEATLRQQLAEMTLRFEKERESLLQRLERRQPSVQVEVNLPTPLRLKIFTGIAPSSANEVDFDSWIEQVEFFLKDPDVKPRDSRIFASLRGIAGETVKDCRSNVEAVKVLKEIFGSVQDADDLLLAFASSRSKKTETPPDFLSRLYADILRIQRQCNLTSHELQKKLYRTFCAGAQSNHQLLVLEIRNQFGFPGSAAPSFKDLLHAVRQAWSLQDSKAQAHQQQAEDSEETLTNKLVEKVFEGVMKKMEQREIDKPGRPRDSQSDYQRERKQRRFCYKCGVDGHFANLCRNKPNPGLVEQKRKNQGHAGGLN